MPALSAFLLLVRVLLEQAPSEHNKCLSCIPELYIRELSNNALLDLVFDERVVLITQPKLLDIGLLHEVAAALPRRLLTDHHLPDLIGSLREVPVELVDRKWVIGPDFSASLSNCVYQLIR